MVGGHEIMTSPHVHPRNKIFSTLGCNGRGKCQYPYIYQILSQFRQLQIGWPKVMAPLANAVALVHYQQPNFICSFQGLQKL